MLHSRQFNLGRGRGMIHRTETEPAEQAQPLRLTLLAALKDLGWFSGIFATLVGAPSILAIIQAVFIDYNLIPLLQWIVDGWNQLLYFLAMAIEPGAIWIIQIINNIIDFNLDLHAHWRPIFALSMVLVMPSVRQVWGQGRNTRAFLFLIIYSFTALTASITVGLFSPSEPEMLISQLINAFTLSTEAGWIDSFVWSLIANFFVICALTGSAVGVLIIYEPGEYGEKLPPMSAFIYYLISIFLFPFIFILNLNWFLGIDIFSLGFGINGVQVAILMLGLLIAWTGMRYIRSGFSGNYIGRVRRGLSILGGFVTAGLIVSADAILKLLQAVN